MRGISEFRRRYFSNYHFQQVTNQVLYIFIRCRAVHGIICVYMYVRIYIYDGLYYIHAAIALFSDDSGAVRRTERNTARYSFSGPVRRGVTHSARATTTKNHSEMRLRRGRGRDERNNETRRRRRVVYEYCTRYVRKPSRIGVRRGARGILKSRACGFDVRLPG